MNKISLNSEILEAIRGEFTPTQLSARLFMNLKDIDTTENYLIWFHERFHYLQSIFTPYGQLKWGGYRSTSGDIVSEWLQSGKNSEGTRKIPIADYLADDTKESYRFIFSIWLKDAIWKNLNYVERGVIGELYKSTTPMLTIDKACPTIRVNEVDYQFRTIDVIESYAKFEEALLSEVLTGKSLGEYINPSRLGKEYYLALYYFIEQVGLERLVEFPIVCELALACKTFPLPNDFEIYNKNAPNCRFIKIIEIIKKICDLPRIDLKDNQTFYDYTSKVLSLCEFESWDELWNSREEYVKSCNLKMSMEMGEAIEFKKSNPWILSYPTINWELFTSEEFNRFNPYFTILGDSVMYSVDNITSDEFIFENNFQALSSQICGYQSKYCIYPKKLMCGFSYMGLKACPHILSGECDGHVNSDNDAPEFCIDGDDNITGCTFKAFLSALGTSIDEISIGEARILTQAEFFKCVEIFSEANDKDNE